MSLKYDDMPELIEGDTDDDIPPLEEYTNIMPLEFHKKHFGKLDIKALKRLSDIYLDISRHHERHVKQLKARAEKPLAEWMKCKCKCVVGGPWLVSGGVVVWGVWTKCPQWKKNKRKRVVGNPWMGWVWVDVGEERCIHECKAPLATKWKAMDYTSKDFADFQDDLLELSKLSKEDWFLESKRALI